VARTREQAEGLLGRWLGAERVLWLGDGIVGDDTDGHVDDIARFVSPTTVVAAVEPDARDENHRPLADNLARLRAMRDGHGRPYEVVELPMPGALVVDGVRLPASHANFYIANRVVLLPVFGGESDARSAAILRELCPDREVVGIASQDLVVGLGAVHCLTQQEPAAGPVDSARAPQRVLPAGTPKS
jgi:agmatine deiminase